jgi:tetratricopeptide (TPR) repeat protein
MNKNGFSRVVASIFQKTIPVLSGLVLSLVLLEAGLRLGGFVFSSIQAYENLRSIKQKSTYRIVCIGESTTQRQYPHLLEQVLNQRNIGVRFSVIDKGRAAMNSITLLEGIESNLTEYHPDMVVVMMGINDTGIKYYEDIPKSDTWLFRHCRTYRFGSILFMHMLKKINREDIDGFDKIDSNRKARPEDAATVPLKANLSNATSTEKVAKQDLNLPGTRHPVRAEMEAVPNIEDTERTKTESVAYSASHVMIGVAARSEGAAEPRNSNLNHSELPDAEKFPKKTLALFSENENTYLRSGELYKNQGKFSQAEESYRKALEMNPGNDNTYVDLGWLYRVQGKYSQAEAFYKKALELNPKNGHACGRLGWLYHDQGKFAEAEDFYKKAIEFNLKKGNACYSLGILYRDQGKLSQAEDSLRRAVEFDPENERTLGAMASLYEEMGKPELAKAYAEKANKLRSEHYPEITVNNYRKLKEILDRKGIKLVCVQYPVRNVGPLKRIFEKDNDVIFVDNERIFKEALRQGSYKEYFKDMFAGDFGHCTPKGNMLIAQNIAHVILKEVFNKQ